MLGSIAGGESLEILVALRNLSSAGFSKVQADIARTEAVANRTNMGGFSKAAKTAEKDATKFAGQEVKGGGGLGGMVAGLTGLSGPLAVAAIGIAGLGALAMATIPTYEKVEQQEKALAIAAKDHGIALEDMNTHVEAAIKTGEQYAYGADDTRAAIAKLTEAGMSLADQQAALPHIMDLARVKGLDLADAARQYTLVLMGNTRAIKDLGIAFPKLTAASTLHDKATKEVTKDTAALHTAQAHLATVEASLAGKHHLTASEALKLKHAHDQVSTATLKLHRAQHNLTAVQGDAATKARRLKLLNDDLTGSIGDQAGAITPLQAAQTKLGNVWEKFATTIGPALAAALKVIIDAITNLLNGLMAIGDWWAKNGPKFTNNNGQPVYMSQPGAPSTSYRGKPTPTGHAAGGWAGLHGEEIIRVGENEPEFIVPRSKMGSMGGGTTVIHTHLHVDGREMAEVVSQHQGRQFALVGGSSMFSSGA